MNYFFTFVTMAFPKAGAQIAGIPLTVSTVLLMLLLVCNIQFILHDVQRIRGLLGFYSLLFFSCIFILLVNYGGISAMQINKLLVVLGSPLAFVAIRKVDGEKGAVLTAIALTIVSGYAVVQSGFGITNTAIAGLTYTQGQNLESKPIGYGFNDSTFGANKMPSTYQNGNGYGLFIALAIPFLLIWKPKTKFQKFIRLFSIVLGFVGLLLCGSRSIIIPLVVMVFFMLRNYYKLLPVQARGKAITGIILLLIMAGIYLAVFQQEFLTNAYDRLIVSTLNDPTATGRTVQWSDMAQIIGNYSPGQFIRFLLVGAPWNGKGGGEGFLEFLFHFGVPATVGLFGCLISTMLCLWKNRATRPVAFGAASVIFAFCIDQSYYYPPALINFFMVAMLAVKMAGQKDDLKLKQPIYGPQL